MFLVPPVPGFVFVISWLLLLIPVEKIKNIRKIRKWFVYLFKNFHKKKVIKQKFFDIFNHSKDIFK